MGEDDIAGARAAGYSDEEIAKSLADKHGLDYAAATTQGGYAPHEIIQQLTGVGPEQQTPQFSPQNLPVTSEPRVAATAGAFVGAIPAVKAGVKSVKELWTSPSASSTPENLASFLVNTGQDTAEGAQKYTNKLLGAPGVKIPLSEIEKITGRAPGSIDTIYEAAQALKDIRGREESPVNLFAPDPKNPNLQIKTGERYTYATPKIDISHLEKMYSGPFASPQATVNTIKNAGVATGQKLLKYGLPVANAAGMVGDFQDAINRFEAGEYGRSAISGIGSGGALLSMFPSVPSKVAGTSISIAAPILNEYLDRVLGRNSVFEKPGMNRPTTVKYPASGFSFGMKEGGSIAEMKAAVKMANGGLYENIHAKQERIAHGSGERMRKPGSEGAPTEEAFIESAKTAKMKEGGLSLSVGRGEKLPTSQGAGLTAKGREKYNRETGSHLQAPQPEGGSRKDSFCARMQGVVDHAKGDAERAKASLKRWKC
jgi:hypothetical protein